MRLEHLEDMLGLLPACARSSHVCQAKHSLPAVPEWHSSTQAKMQKGGCRSRKLWHGSKMRCATSCREPTMQQQHLICQHSTVVSLAADLACCKHHHVCAMPRSSCMVCQTMLVRDCPNPPLCGLHSAGCTQQRTSILQATLAMTRPSAA